MNNLSVNPGKNQALCSKWRMNWRKFKIWWNSI